MAHLDATHATRAPAADRFQIGRLLTAPFRGVWNVLMAIAESNASVREVERLSAMSDAELDRRGLKREDIVREVFMKGGLY